MTTTLEFWYEFASTYSYVSAMRIADLAEARGVTVRWRPFLLGPIFAAQGWTSSPFNLYPAKGAYMWRDMERLCAAAELPLVRPDPFPQNSLLAARLAVAGFEEGWGETFTEAVFVAEFGEGLDIGNEETLREILAGLRIDPGPAFARARSDEIKARLRAETEEARSNGIFGAPAFVAPDGELFWGNDRLEQAIDWAARLTGKTG